MERQAICMKTIQEYREDNKSTWKIQCGHKKEYNANIREMHVKERREWKMKQMNTRNVNMEKGKRDQKAHTRETIEWRWYENILYNSLYEKAKN